MRIKSTFIGLILLLGIQMVYGQGFKEPAEGNAVVYFVRISSYGFAVSFEFFHQDQYIGSFKGENYMRYECEAGEQLFWASSENKEFVTADLAPGGSYIVVVDVIMGFWKAHVGLSPIDMNDKDRFSRSLKLIKTKSPVEITQKEIDKKNKKLKKFIPDMLERYEREWKNTKDFRHISAEMAVPAEEM